MTTLNLSSQDAAALELDALVVGVGKGPDGPVLAPGADAVDAATGGGLLETLVALGAGGNVGDVVRTAATGLGAPVLVAVGLGPVPAGGAAYDLECLRRAAGAAVRSLAGRHAVALTLVAAGGGTPGAVRAVGEGALLAAYSYDRYRSKGPVKAPVTDVTLVVPDTGDAAVKAAGRRAEAVARAVGLCRDLVNTPPSDLHPAELAEAALHEAERLGLSVEVLDETALREGGFGGILGVGQGSEHPPRLTRIAWTPEGARRTVALVGKGITFDSGGLSIKPSSSMETMKSDMGGAAAVLATVTAVAQLELPVNVVAWLPSAENMPSGTAIRPSDVLHMYGGKTVEVLNTDAEGRLVLGDALVRAGEEQPDYLIDVATLTGAQVVALGNRVTGVMGNDDDFRDRVVQAAERAGEASWPMPLPEDLRKGLDSDVADLKNVSSGREAGMLVAGLFLREFVPAGTPWAHLDIAGPSFNSAEPHGYTPKGGTGAGVRTLVQLCEDLSGQAG